MASPLFPLGLSFICGLILSRVINPPLFLALFPFFLCLGLAWFFYLRRNLKSSFALAILSFLFFGFSFYLVKNQAFEKNPLRLINSQDYVDIEGKIEKTPDLYRNRYRLLIKTEKIRFKGLDHKVKGRLQVTFLASIDSPAKEFFAGDRVRLSARFLDDDDFSNFQQPISLTSMKAHGIHRRAFSKSELLLEKTGEEKLYLPRFFSWLNSRIQQRIERFFKDPEGQMLEEGAFLEALLLGKRGRLREETLRALQSSGLFHLIAISGAHIAIISYFLFQFLRLFRISDQFRSLALIICLLFYAILVEGRPSVVRATVMAILYLTARLWWKDLSFLNSLAASAFFLLLLNPLQLFEASFILTFMATLTIILFFPRMKKYFPLLPGRLSDLIILSITAQLGVLPFIALIFNRITLGNLILNLPAVPLIGLIMASGFLFLFISVFSFTLGSFLAVGIKKMINFFFLMIHFSDKVRPLSYRIPPPSFLIMAGYFAFLFLLIFPKRFRYQRPLAIFGFSLFTFFILFHPFPGFISDLRLTFLDVGQGESILIEFPGREKMLVDGGGFQSDSFDVGEYVVCPFLWRRGLKKIDYLVLTHAHPDHLNGLKAVARNFSIQEFWVALEPADSKDYSEFISCLSSKTKRIKFFQGEKRKIADLELEFLHPAAPKKSPAPVSNEDSLVFRLKKGQQGLALFTADIGISSERELLEADFELEALIFKSPHHGSLNSSSDPFLAKVKPKIIIICAGRNNIYGVPHPEILRRYRKMGALIFRTDLDGAIELTFREKNLRIRTSRTRLDILQPLN